MNGPKRPQCWRGNRERCQSKRGFIQRPRTERILSSSGTMRVQSSRCRNVSLRWIWETKRMWSQEHFNNDFFTKLTDFLIILFLNFLDFLVGKWVLCISSNIIHPVFSLKKKRCYSHQDGPS